MPENEFSSQADMFQAIAEKTHVYLAFLDPQFNFVWVNSAYAQGSGHSITELIGRNHFDLFPNPENQTIFERARDTGQPVAYHAKPFEYADQPQRGITYWDWTLVPAKDQDGSVQGLVFSLLDVTDRVRAEVALQERTHQLGERVKELNCLFGISALAEKSDHSLNEILQGTVELLPPAWQYPEITGARIILEGQEFRTQRFAENAPRQQAADIFVRGQRSGTVEVCYLEERPPCDEGPFLQDERHLIDAVAGHLGRIVARVRAEELLREQNEFITSVFEALSYPFYVIDAHDYTIKMANSAAYQGELPESITCYALTHRQSKPCWEAGHICPLEEIKKTGEPAMVEHVHYDRQGQRRFYEVHGHPIHDSEGQLTQVIEYTLDVTERKRAEQALQRERDLTSAVLDTAGALVVVLDRQGRIRRFNRACETLTGYTFDEVEGQYFWERLLVPEEVDPVMAVFRQLQAGQFPNTFENYWVTREGDRRLIAWSNSALLDDAGEVEHVIGTGIDITERVQAETALRESEKKYRQLIELAQEGVWTIDADAFTSFVNPRMAEMLGYTVEEMQGRHLFSFMDKRGVEIAERNLERRRQGISEQHDFEFLRKDGSRIYTSMETSPITDESGAYVGALALVADITERRRAEDALREAHHQLEQRVQERTAELLQANERLQAEIHERRRVESELRASEERFRQLAENINEVFWITDLHENRLLYVSPTYEQMWGRPREKLYQRPEPFLEGVHSEDCERLRAVLERQSQEETDETYRILRPDGALRWIRARTFPIWNVLGQVYRAAGIAEDITERVQAYQILEQRVEERTRELSTLLEISRHVALTMDLQPLLDLILDQLQAVVGYDDASIFKLEGDVLTPLAHRGTVPREKMLEQRFSLQQAPFVRQMILNQETVFIPDVRGETPLARDFRRATGTRLDTLYAGVRSWMGTPLAIKDQVVGILTLKYTAVNRFTPEQVDLVVGLANQAAVAIENNRLYEQAQVLAAVEERQRLARDLHDAVSQTLFSASLAAEVLPRLWENQPTEGRRCLAELQQLTRGALAEMRTLLLELRPAALVEVALDDLLRQLAEAASTRARLPVDITLEGRPTLPPEVHVALYRIAQEALNNVVKHAGASRMAVTLRLSTVPPHASHPTGGTERGPAAGTSSPARGTDGGTSPPTGGIEGGVELRIEDDGRGFDPAGVSADRLGLSIMRERAAAIGAEMSIQSRSGRGTRLIVAWPGAT